MKNKKLIIIVGILSFIVSVIFTFIYYNSKNHLIIYTSDTSYAYEFAKKKFIKTYTLSDSNFKKFQKVRENFSLKKEFNGLVITQYEGISEELIIPTIYNNQKIIKIEKGALPSSVKSVFIPDSIETVEESDFENIEILCFKSKNCDKLKENENLKVKEIEESDYYKLYEKDLEFDYDIINNNEIELTRYIGNKDYILIPEKINGYKVTSINFDAEGITAIFIPETVISINGDITSKLLNKCFVFSIIILLATVIIFSIAILFSKIHEIIDGVYLYPISIISLVVINYYVYIIRINPLEYIKYIIYSGITSIIYLILIWVINSITKNNKKFDNDIKHKNDFIKEANLLLQDFDFEELKEVAELIKYSDPVSIKEVVEIENNIIDDIKTINKDNVIEKVKELKKLINKRNTIIKDKK